jgi:hypothetical protein
VNGDRRKERKERRKRIERKRTKETSILLAWKLTRRILDDETSELVFHIHRRTIPTCFALQFNVPGLGHHLCFGVPIACGEYHVTTYFE